MPEKDIEVNGCFEYESYTISECVDVSGCWIGLKMNSTSKDTSKKCGRMR